MKLLRYTGFLLLPAIIGTTMPLLSQTSIYKVDRLSFNSGEFNEIAPVIVKDGLIFCSDRETSSFTKKTSFSDERLYNLFFAQRKDSTSWKSPEQVKETGAAFLYYGPLAISSDGKTIYFTSSLISGKAARNKNLNNPRGIFSGTLSRNVISNVSPFEYNSNDKSYSVAHPSLSSDGKYLFFASDMPGGQGESDIWFCEKINNKWGKPVNLGPKVNSASRENYPYIHPSGRLYFTTNRKGDADYLGGMDVYFTTLVFGEWDSPVAMQEPINSKSDDFAFVAEDNLQTGYFSRKTGMSDDIWKVTSTIIRKSSCNNLEENNYCYSFTEENAIRYDTLPVPFKFRWNFGDGNTAEGVSVEHCYKNPGDYVVRLDVINLLTNEIEQNDKTYNLPVTQIEQAYISGPDKCNTGQAINLNADSTYLPGWTINQYYWNFGDESIGLGKNVQKIYQRPGNYSIQLIVSSVPDSQGLVRETCVSKNITVSRIP
jgi:hypothetical protein